MEQSLNGELESADDELFELTSSSSSSSSRFCIW